MMIIGPQTKHLLCIQNRPTCNTEATETVPPALNTPTLHYDVNISHPETRHPLDSRHVVIASTRQIDCIPFFSLSYSCCLSENRWPVTVTIALCLSQISLLDSTNALTISVFFPSFFFGMSMERLRAFALTGRSFSSLVIFFTEGVYHRWSLG